MKKVIAALGLMAVTASSAHADATNQELLSVLNEMKSQMAVMQSTIDRQNTRIAQLETGRPSEAPPATQSSGAAMSDADFQKSLKDNIGEAVSWMKGLKQGGDFRLRYEAFEYMDKETDAGATGTAADRTRNRFRIRLRWGVEKELADDWKVGFRLATGSTTDQASTNTTLGNPGYFTFKTILIDRAYAMWSPNGMKDYGAIKGLTIGAGKFENPFLRYATPIVWDADVTPEGAFEKINLQLLGEEDNKLNLNLVAGQFLTHENAGNETDAQLYGYQGALTWSTYNFGTDLPVEITGAASFYDYTNWFQTVTATNVVSATGSTTSFLRTNTIVADDFRVLDLYPEAVFYWDRTPVTLWYNYVENLGNVGTEDIDRSLGNDIHDADTAWGVGAKIGKLKKKGDWESHYGYYEIGANAVVAAFNDSDFGGPGTTGHTNRKGHKFGVSYQLTDAVQVNWTGYLVAPLNPSTLVANSTNEDVFRSQFDAVYKF